MSRFISYCMSDGWVMAASQGATTIRYGFGMAAGEGRRRGAVRLSELHRFTDPAEAAATLALRDGRPESLGFYLDRRSVHVGDPTTTLDNVFNG
jgi:hypothetical protein